tara:strand:- start:83 stop:532 length:450 start_codon:yes stop_codon:yes gene_type:complete
MFRAVLISFFAIIICFGIMDAIWLGIVADGVYQQEMQGLLRTQYPVWPWVSFYLIYSFSIVILAVQPSFALLLQQTSLVSKELVIVAFRGAVLGLAAYGAYNLTNYAILANWSLKISLIDWMWGCFITTCSAASAGLAVSAFGKLEKRQ